MNGKAYGVKAKRVYLIYQGNVTFLFCTKNPRIMGIFFDVFVIYHYLSAQLNQVRTPAAGTLLYACTANGFCRVVSARKKYLFTSF